MNEKATFLKRVLCIVSLLCSITSLGTAQQTHSTNNSQTIFDRLQSNLRVELSGSTIATTHGMQLTFPAFWVGNQIKVEPLVGFFWEDFTNTFPAGGIRMIYYFKRQPFDGPTVNSLYAGVSGMDAEFEFFGREVTNISVAGLLVGHSFGLSSRIELNPEVLLGFDESGDFRPEAGVSLVFHFSR